MQTLNLLPLQQHPAQFFIQRLWRHFYRGALVIMTVMAGLYLIQSLYLKHMAENLAALEKRQLARASQILQLEILNEKKATNAHQMRQLNLQQENNQPLLMMLNALPHIMPDDLYLMNAQWSENSGALEGRAKDEETIMTFVQALKRMGYFDHIERMKNDKAHDAQSIYFKLHFSSELRYELND